MHLLGPTFKGFYKEKCAQKSKNSEAAVNLTVPSYQYRALLCFMDNFRMKQKLINCF